MRRRGSRPVLAVALLLLVGASETRAQTAENVLVVINALSQASGEIADYYARARAIPGAQVLRLPLPDNDELPRNDYVNKIERRARIRASVTKQLEANPELKEAYRKLVKNLPAEQQERAMMSIAARTLRTITPRQQQSQGARV